MKSRSIVPFVSRHYDSFLAALAGAFIIYLFTRHSGIGVSPDSVVYMSAAEHLASDGAFLNFDSSPIVIFPAFYPLFLGALSFITRVKPLLLGPALDMTLFAGVIFLSGWMMERFQNPSKWYKRIFLSFLVLSPCLLEIYSMMWSETLFILLLFFFILALRKYFHRPSWWSLLTAGLLAALACVTRFAGVTLVATGGLLLFFNPAVKWGRRIRDAVIFGFVAVSLLVGNLVRNSLVSGTLTGDREKGNTSLWQNISHYGSVFGDWWPFFKHPPPVPLVTGILLLLVFTALLAKRLLQKQSLDRYENLSLAFFVVYSWFMVISATVSRYEPINSRLLSPLYISALWALTAWIPGWVRSGIPRRRAWIIALCVLGAAAFQVNQLGIDYENWDGIKDAGIPGYTEDDWTQSPTMQFVEKHKAMFEDQRIYSDANDAIWFFTKLEADLLPHKESREEIQEWVEDDDGYLIWFNDAYNDEEVTVQDIRKFKKVVCLYKFDDGAIYSYAAP